LNKVQALNNVNWVWTCKYMHMKKSFLKGLMKKHDWFYWSVKKIASPCGNNSIFYSPDCPRSHIYGWGWENNLHIISNVGGEPMIFVVCIGSKVDLTTCEMNVIFLQSFGDVCHSPSTLGMFSHPHWTLNLIM